MGIHFASSFDIAIEEIVVVEAFVDVEAFAFVDSLTSVGVELQ